MKTNYLIYVLIVGLFLLSSVQIFNVLYGEDEEFNSEIEKQLVSVVQIKGERINDYFLERGKDARVLADSKEIRETLDSEVGYDIIIEENMKKKLEIISKQIEIFINKYPEMTVAELQNDEDFRKILLQNFGENSRFLLINAETNEIILDEKTENVGKNIDGLGGRTYVKNINLNSGDGISLGLGYVIYEGEFRIIKGMSTQNRDYLDNFVKISDYFNLLLIDSNGYMIYETAESFDYGVDLDSSANSKSDLGKVYSIVRNTKQSLIYGPYMRENLDGSFDLILAFAAPVSNKGIVILQTKMDEINEIVLEDSGFGNSGEVYLLNNENLLLTLLGDKNILVQEITNANSKQCFEKKDAITPLDELISRSYDFKGDKTLGTYSYITETDWCLISEFSAEEIFEAPKKGRIRISIIFVLVFNFVLLIVGCVLVNKFNKEGKKR